MGKYEPLTAWLRSCDRPAWVTSFGEIEALLGFRLPQSARRYSAWWANQTGRGHVQSTAWREVGWITRNLDLTNGRVEFERVGRDSGRVASAEDGQLDALYAQASEYSGIKDRSVLIAKALEALIQREASRRLMGLGGTMPGFVAPPRERPT